MSLVLSRLLTVFCCCLCCRGEEHSPHGASHLEPGAEGEDHQQGPIPAAQVSQVQIGSLRSGANTVLVVFDLLEVCILLYEAIEMANLLLTFSESVLAYIYLF